MSPMMLEKSFKYVTDLVIVLSIIIICLVYSNWRESRQLTVKLQKMEQERAERTLVNDNFRHLVEQKLQLIEEECDRRRNKKAR